MVMIIIMEGTGDGYDNDDDGGDDDDDDDDDDG